ncbi:hypothetical protein R3P38DRAFT_3539454 [Favolaschia claudopus]|uniref:Uncharacterized protein n=1 Tax=Favolaschia claudopus TaxID=2862362 RepID=A0AAW0B8F3_9AGAR
MRIIPMRHKCWDLATFKKKSSGILPPASGVETPPPSSTSVLVARLLYNLTTSHKGQYAQDIPLIRGSPAQAISQEKKTLQAIRPHGRHLGDDDNLIQLVVGDIPKQNFAIEPAFRQTLIVIIYEVASLHWTSKPWQTAYDDCRPVLRLENIAAAIKKLTKSMFIDEVAPPMGGARGKEAFRLVGATKQHLAQILIVARRGFGRAPTRTSDAAHAHYTEQFMTAPDTGWPMPYRRLFRRTNLLGGMPANLILLHAIMAL